METIKVKNEVGYVSLVGIIGDDYPLDRGNYFSLGGYHVLNMWYENFEHLGIRRDYIDAVKIGNKHIIIIDEDIPDDYLNNKPCFTGGGGMTKELYKEVFDFMFPKFHDLKCLCCESANNVSVSFHTGIIGGGGGISLAQGNCMICGREVLTNNNSEINQDVWDKLRDIQKGIKNGGVYLAPWRVLREGEEIAEDPTPENQTRYERKHNRGMIKKSDLKEN
jgi:hypothetical protein